MEESNFFYHFRMFYGQTQLQNFQQQNRRKSGQLKHPTVRPRAVFDVFVYVNLTLEPF